MIEAVKGSIQRRGEKWRIVLDAPPHPVTGARRQVTRTLDGTLPRSDVELALAKLLVEVAGGQHVGADATLGQVIDAWLDVARLSPSTRRDYGYARRKIPQRLTTTAVHKVTARDLDALYAQLERDGLGPDRIRRVHGIVRRATPSSVATRALVPRSARANASTMA